VLPFTFVTHVANTPEVQLDVCHAGFIWLIAQLANRAASFSSNTRHGLCSNYMCIHKVTLDLYVKSFATVELTANYVHGAVKTVTSRYSFCAVYKSAYLLTYSTTIFSHVGHNGILDIYSVRLSERTRTTSDTCIHM